MPVFAECAELANGALIASLAEAVGCTRDTIYGTIRGTRGMSPDMLWRQGWALRDLGVTWMSGLLALGLEEQYDAHFYGVIGEAILGSPTDIIIRWTALEIIRARKSVFDVIEGHSGYSEQQIKTKIDDFLNHSGNMTVPNAQVRPFQRAWLRWYAVSPNELKFRENESRFKKVATPLTEAISILRESQRKSDPWAATTILTTSRQLSWRIEAGKSVMWPSFDQAQALPVLEDLILCVTSGAQLHFPQQRVAGNSRRSFRE